MPKICHITTAHPRYDIRIFLKECCSLAERYETHLVVSDGKGDEVKNLVHIHDTQVRAKNRLTRFIRVVYQSYKKALSLNCDIYHFHDPDFILAAALLRSRGKKVIYDTHEDVPRQILTKEYLGIFKRPIAWCFEVVENWVARRLTAVIAATPFIRKRYLKLNSNSYNINNYPLLSELTIQNGGVRKPDAIVYVGGVTRIKGVAELIDAMSFVPATLELAGPFESEAFRQELASKPGWKKVRYHGNIERHQVLDLLKTCTIGVVTFNPVPNYINSLPIKMFEYMSAGLPVVCSNFRDWKEIIDDNDCGVSADPLNPSDIANKIKQVLGRPQTLERMGQNGIRMITTKFNWDQEKKKLFDVYSDLLGEPLPAQKH